MKAIASPRTVGLLGAAVLVLVLAASATSAANRPLLVEAAGATFPDGAWVLTLPMRRSLSASQIHVTENGSPVRNVSIDSGQTPGRPKFAVVMAIDASNSMAGKPIEAAMAAARTFEARRDPETALAVVTFNGDVQVLLPMTTNATSISAALSGTPTLSNGTKIYDGLAQARKLLEETGAPSSSVILLSDGADLGSGTKPAEVLQGLAADKVRVFSVGLKSGTYDPKTLTEAASATGGSLAEAAKPAELTGIFNSLGASLSNQYVVNYRSLANPGAKVVVKVAVAGIPNPAIAGYQAPPLHIVPAPPYHPSQVTKIVESPWTAAAIALLIAALIGWGVLTMLSHRSESVPTRVGHFVSIDEQGAGRSLLATDETLNRRDRPFERHRMWQDLQNTLSIADIKMSAGQLVMLTVLATLTSLVVFVLLLGGWGILIALAVPFVVRSWVLSKQQKRRRTFSDQLPENLEVLASSLRTGHSLAGGLSVVIQNTPEPSKSELQRALVEERLGVPLEDALKVVVERMDNRDLDQVALVARLQRDMGSNSADVLDRVVESVRAKMALRRLVQTLTAQGRFSRWILTALPVGLALAMAIIQPGYLSPLYDTSSGRILVAIAVLMIIAGSVIIGRIVNIKV